MFFKARFFAASGLFPPKNELSKSLKKFRFPMQKIYLNKRAYSRLLTCNDKLKENLYTEKMTELLAPAGNIEALDAAIGEGADAV